MVDVEKDTVDSLLKCPREKRRKNLEDWNLAMLVGEMSFRMIRMAFLTDINEFFDLF